MHLIRYYQIPVICCAESQSASESSVSWMCARCVPILLSRLLFDRGATRDVRSHVDHYGPRSPIICTLPELQVYAAENCVLTRPQAFLIKPIGAHLNLFQAFFCPFGILVQCTVLVCMVSNFFYVHWLLSVCVILMPTS